MIHVTSSYDVVYKCSNGNCFFQTQLLHHALIAELKA